MHHIHVLFILVARGLGLPILSVDNLWNTHLRQRLPHIPTNLSPRNHVAIASRRTTQHLDDFS